MEDRILDIVVFMISHLREKSGELENLSELAPDLQSKGFTSSEINSAYSWVFDRFGATPGRVVLRDEPQPHSVRVLSPQERLVLETEAYGYLLRLLTLGILRQVELEEIIESCAQAGRVAVDAAEIKDIVSTILFEEDSPFYSHRSFGREGDDLETVN